MSAAFAYFAGKKKESRDMNKYERCLWIVSTFIDYGDMSLKELNERFREYSLNYDGEEIPARTFDRDRRYIATTFQIDIDFDPRVKKYKLMNPEEIRDNPLYKYLMGSIHVNNLSTLALRHREKIMLQEMPTGVESLHVLLDAIDKGKTVRFEYVSYYAKDRVGSYEVIPCFVRLFERRWYLICEYLDHSKTRVLALERTRGLSIGEKSCQPSPEITLRLFYQDCFGVIHDDKQPEEIVLKVYGHQVDYVRSTPIHASQKEIETTREYALFQYYLRPSFDFVQHLLWHRENLEVVRPTSLRDETRELLRQMLARYEKAPDR